jgi:hypothetical protein
MNHARVTTAPHEAPNSNKNTSFGGNGSEIAKAAKTAVKIRTVQLCSRSTSFFDELRSLETVKDRAQYASLLIKAPRKYGSGKMK